MSTDTLTVSVWRGGTNGRTVDYKVPKKKNQMVLDVVTFIQKNIDADLSYRFACRVGVCGSCAMTVNGRARWTCRTHVDKVSVQNQIRIEPLRSFRIIKDLAVDMTDFFSKWVKAKGVFEPTATRNDEVCAIQPSEKMRQLASEGIECISCGVCYASCDIVKWNSEYLGPAALNRAWTLINDIRDGAKNERLSAVAGDAGCHSCHSQQGCTESCPKQLNPTKSIAGLKRATAWAALKGDL